MSAAPDETAKPPADSWALLVREPGVLQRLICVAFAWAATVAPAAVSRAANWPARVLAMVALVAGVCGPVIAARHKRLGRHVGITAFLALTCATWLLTPRAIAIENVDTVVATMGGVAWGVFALSWGEPWRLREETSSDDPGTILRARAELPPFAVPIAALGVACALVVVVLSFRVRNPDRALLAQAVGVGLGVWLVTAAANIAIQRGKARPPAPGLPAAGARALIALVAIALLGGAILILRAQR